MRRSSSASSADSPRPPTKAVKKPGRLPLKFRSTNARLSARCTSSRDTSAVTTAFSVFTTPRSVSRLITV